MSRGFRSSLHLVALSAFFALAACSQPASSGKPSASSDHPAASSSVAATSAVTQDSANDLVQRASHGQAHVDHIFKGPDGMVGAVVINANQTKDIIFISPGGKVLFPGGGFTAEGKNIAEEALISEHVYISPEELAQKASQVGFVVGKSGPIITAFVDPNCYWCHVLYTKINPLVEAGKVRVRYVVIAAIKPSSPARAAAILAAKDPAKAMKLDEEKFNVKAEEGGISPLKTPDPAAEAQVRANTALMASAGKVSTPGLLYCAAATKKLVYALGMPQDIDGFIAGSTTEGDPSCAK